MVVAEAPSAATMSDAVDTALLPAEIAQLYRALAREDLPKRQSPNVAQGMPYIDGETCLQVLNQVIGIHRWSFKIVEHGFNTEADEIWALGRLTVWWPMSGADVVGDNVIAIAREREIVHEQFGGKKLVRSRKDNSPVNYGFDLKAAGTEALKKCASQIGIGLYLSRKESAWWDAQEAGEPPKPPTRAGARPAAPRTNGSSAAASAAPANGSTSTSSINGSSNGAQTCDVCGTPLVPVHFDNSKANKPDEEWSIEKLIQYSQSKYDGTIACWDHYRELKKRKENKPHKLPPENEWKISISPISTNGSSATSTAATTTSSRPRPSVQAPAILKGLRESLEASAATKGERRLAHADQEQLDWLRQCWYDAIGDAADEMILALFGGTVSLADIDAADEWMQTREPEDKWVKRITVAAQALSSTAAA